MKLHLLFSSQFNLTTILILKYDCKRDYKAWHRVWMCVDQNKIKLYKNNDKNTEFHFKRQVKRMDPGGC